MAEQPQQPAPSNRMIIESYAQDALAQMAEANKVGLESFGKELNQIAKSLQVLETSIPKAIAEAMKNVAQSGGSGGERGSRSANASVAAVDYAPKPYDINSMTEREWVAGRGPGGPGKPPMTPQEAHKHGRYNWASRATVEEMGFESPADYRRAVKEKGEEFAGASPATRMEKLVYGKMGLSPNASVAVAEGVEGAGRFQKRFDDQNYTAQDYGNLAADILAKGGQFAKGRGNESLYHNALSASTAIGYASDKYLAPLDMAKGIVDPYMQRRKDRTELGTAFGGNPQTGDIELPGGFGMRTHSILTNDATRMGAAMQLKALFDARAAGMNKDDVGKMMAGLGSMGYKPTSAMGVFTNPNDRFNRLLATQESLYRRDPNLVNPLQERMMDRGTRFDDTDTSLKTLRKAFLDMADTSNKTNLSIGQMQAAADSFGKFVESQGGTYAQGVAQSQQFSAATGLPGEVFQTMQNQPYTKANQITSSGLAPWQLGNLTGGQRMSSMYQTLGMVERMAKQGDKTGTDPVTGQKYTISGEKLTQDTMAMMLPGMTQQQIATLMKYRQQNLSTGNISSSFENVYLKSGNQSSWDKINAEMKKGQFSDEERARIHDAGDVSTAEGRKKQYEEYKKVVEEHGQKQQKEMGKGKEGDGKSTEAGGVKITLSDQAAKIFNINNEGAKAAAGAGGSAIVQAATAGNPAASMVADLISDLNPF